MESYIKQRELAHLNEDISRDSRGQGPDGRKIK
jgi:hypothetical protein